MPKLDKRSAASLPGPEAGRFDVIHWDDDLPGFGLRVLASGARSWCVRYRIGKKSRLIGLGKLAALKPADARSEAKRILAGAKLGRDERLEIASRKAQSTAPAGKSFSDVVALYVRHVVSGKRLPTQVERKRHLEVYAKPLHQKPIAQIDLSAVATLLLDIKDRHGMISANRARASLSALFSWGMSQGLVGTNPVIGTAKPGEERKRDRVLSGDEIRWLWQATEGPGEYNIIVRLLLLLGQRRSEVGGMRWSELGNLQRAMWSLPDWRTKNGKPHQVPLPRQAIAILETVPRREGRDLVFGQADGPFAGWPYGKARLDQRIADLRRKEMIETGVDPDKAPPLQPFVLHDIRRTVVTGMNELGIMPHVIESAVNHVSGAAKMGTAGVYNRAIYAAEKRAALQAWADHLDELVGNAPAKVVPLVQPQPRQG